MHKPIVKYYYQSEKIHQSYYVNDGGNIDGEYKEWYSNGDLWIHCHYRNGEKHGEYKEWSPNGEIVKHCVYYVHKK